jgi:hypothetical protein
VLYLGVGHIAFINCCALVVALAIYLARPLKTAREQAGSLFSRPGHTRARARAKLEFAAHESSLPQ